jgi:hypothetical protein
MTTTNKRLLISESRGDSNRCIPCRGKSDQHDTYASCGRSPYVATFRGTPTDLDRSHCSREKGFLTQSIARRLTDPRVRTQLLSWASQWSRGISQAPDGDQLLGLSDTYHRHAIGTFNTYSRGSTERSLIDTGEATTLEVPTCHIPLFDLPDQLSPLSPSGPARSSFNQVLTTKPKCWVLKNLCLPRGLLTTWPSTIAYIYA